MSVLGDLGKRQTPQVEKARQDQVENSAGGYAFGISDAQRLNRFLVLGVDAGTYYASARTLAVENASVIDRCLDADPEGTVGRIVTVSEDGRAPSNDPAIFALAVAAAHPKAKHAALAAVPRVCRIGTHLFHFATFVQNQRGWGPSLRRAVARWYEGDPDDLAYQAVKYRQRDGWTHRDLLRLAHPAAPSPTHRAIYDFICGRQSELEPRIIEGYRKMTEADGAEVAELVREYRLPWETVPSEHLTANTWSALLESGAVPLGALVRNLGVLTNRGVIAAGSKGTRLTVERLGDAEAIRKARIHPVAVLNALLTYTAGTSRGGVTWQPVPQVSDALDAAFYTAFGNVTPTNKRTMLALDISSSMDWATLSNAAFTAKQGAVAMAMVTAAVEPDHTITAFDQGLRLVDVSPRRRLDDNVRSLVWGGGGTDCSLPMLWADQSKVAVDTFIVYTDNETWAGQMHPFQALRQYRERTGIDAKLVVVGMTSTGFSIADPQDAGMLDVVGFNTSTPEVMSAFSSGRF